MVNNGCLCCTVRGDLVKMLLKLVKEKRDKFDRIVIETTGLAKPSPVIETFCSDELVARHVKLDGVVTLVDCKHAMQHLNEVKPRWVVNEAVEQVAYADRIILNKANHHDHVHDSAVSSVSIVSEGTLDLDEFNDWVERLVDEKGDDLYRMKGVISVNESTGRYVFQGVQSVIDGCPAKPWESGEKRINKLALIMLNRPSNRKLSCSTDQIQEARDHIYDVEVKSLELECMEEGFIRCFLEGVRLVQRKTRVEIKELTPSHTSGVSS
ncbi:hypothetical protein MA16_Dca008899 [Dendrobium catenatum]|uniref:CobW/HypB/UreG nucleotide-binding domain-containing protein n=1 Tax=Dendrobium catenatum TaxID=906689 RepID=A0A2I0VUN4_9ASPA|nr:hypothetical protein MA16_Dca008899 [Dendrobium catenatum]